MEDFRGKELKIGDKVVVARKKGHSILLFEGVVVKFTKTGKITVAYHDLCDTKGCFNDWNVCKLCD